MKVFFFDIFGTLVDWRSSIISDLKNLETFKNRLSELELFVINWRKEYQPILNKVNDNSIEWKTLDELHEITLEIVLNKMNFANITNEDKKYLPAIKRVKNKNFSKLLLVIMISIIALVLLIDTFKGPISSFIPNIDFYLDNLYQSLIDIKLFTINLIN